MSDKKRFGGRSRTIYTNYSGYNQRHTEDFESTTSALAPLSLPSADMPGGYFEAERRRPARAMNIESDFITPFFQSLAIALFVSIGGFYLAVAWDTFVWHLSCFAGIIAGAGWFAGAIWFGRDLLWIVERITNEDIDGDGSIGRPDPPQRNLDPVEVIHTDGQGRIKTMYRLDLPNITDQQLVEFAKGVPVKGLAESAWIGGGNPFSSAQYGQLMTELDRAGVVVWKNPNATNQGRQLTRHGADTLEQWAKMGPN